MVIYITMGYAAIQCNQKPELPLMLGIVFSKIISGGQTGVDRAALDAALELGIPCGGWCPKGRKAEDGPIVWGILAFPKGLFFRARI